MFLRLHQFLRKFTLIYETFRRSHVSTLDYQVVEILISDKFSMPNIFIHISRRNRTNYKN